MRERYRRRGRAGMAREHVIDPSVVHHQWDLDLEPLLVIDSGDTVQAWAVIGIFWALWWSRRRQLTSISLSVEV